MNHSLLIELHTEELHLKSLKALSESFANSILAALKNKPSHRPTASARPMPRRVVWPC